MNVRRNIRNVDYGGESPAIRLVCSRCNSCGALMFPYREHCEKCASAAMSEELCGGEGVIWTWTRQNYPPPSPPSRIDILNNEFNPYLVGYVDLGEIKVLGKLVFPADVTPVIGDTVKLGVRNIHVAGVLEEEFVFYMDFV